MLEMLGRTLLNPLHATVSLATLALVLLVSASGVCSLADELEVRDDCSFRRAMLRSTAVFAFESPESALDHWIDLWTVSGELDDRTRSGRRSLLINAVRPLLAKATAPGMMAPVKNIRDRLEERLNAGRLGGEVPSDEMCDWIVLNRVLGENDRTIDWMSHRCRVAPFRPLPKQVKETASVELADDVEWDETCNCPVQKS
ncbi:MAG: hypothetical protein MK116_09685 [Phycisphaerales bacterium]|nr:hypothetical protein [Phycisphaerales bacterium]